MAKKILFLVILLIAGLQPCVSKDKDNDVLSYDIKCGGSAPQGSYLVEVTAYTNNKNVSADYIKKCAVHGVLFKGFSGERGCQSQRPMLSAEQEQQFADFFNNFFKGNDCLAYASLVDSGFKTVKMGKQYAITANVIVSKEDLRKAMEKAGISKKLGF